jgi:hypothetical protein
MKKELFPFFATTHVVAKNFDNHGREVTLCALVDESQNILSIGLSIKNNEDKFGKNRQELQRKARKDAKQLALDRAKNLLECNGARSYHDALSVLLIPKAASQLYPKDITAHWWRNFQKITKTVRKKVYECHKDKLKKRNVVVVEIPATP